MGDQKPGNGKGIVLILNALVWAAAMIAAAYVFRDRSWADDMTLWLIAGFIAVNGLLAGLTRRSRRCD